VMEEQFGWQIHGLVPHALRVIDTQDLHLVRTMRQHIIETQGGCIADAVRAVPSAEDSTTQRELASMYRSDLNLICSSDEMTLLQNTLNFPSNKIALASFFFPPSEPLEKLPRFQNRKNFVTIGNFHHKPNNDSLEFLAREVWPQIRSHFTHQITEPNTPLPEMHIYGAYPTKRHMDMTDTTTGFIVKGPAKSLSTLARYRIMLAPLRFGAGIKGKIADGWRYGVPCVTTPIGAEGMATHKDWWGGECRAMTSHEISLDAVGLYSDQTRWLTAQQNGRVLLENLFDEKQNGDALMKAITRAKTNMAHNRSLDYIQHMLWMQSHRASEFMSKWISEKNKNGKTLNSSAAETLPPST